MATQLENNTSTIESLINAINAMPDAITVDATLTQEGQAADAKAVGDALDCPTFDLTAMGLGVLSYDMISEDTILSEEDVAKFRAVRNGQSITITFEVNVGITTERRYHNGLLNIIDGEVQFLCFDSDGQQMYRGRIDDTSSLELIRTKLSTEGHTHSAEDISNGTFAGQVVANSSDQDPATSLLRNSKLVSAETTPTSNGEIYWTYE